MDVVTAGRFLGVLEGVGSMVTGSMTGGASECACDWLSESDCALPDLRELKTCFLGVL